MIGYIYRNLPADRQLFVLNPKLDKNYIRYTRIRNLAYIIIYDYRYQDVYDRHPVDGLIVTLGSIEPSTSDGSVDILIDNAKKDIDRRTLVAEINEKDTYSKNLFEKHDFKLDRELNGTLYYVYEPVEYRVG